MDDREIIQEHSGPSLRSTDNDKTEESDGSRFGPEPVSIAFSGGGIRSAAFCSGVLRKVVDDGAKVKHLSCVSGGGYIGSSFAEWVANARAAEARKGSGHWPSIKQIADSYFQHLSRNFAIYCDWHHDFPYRGIGDTVIFLLTGLASFFLLPAMALLAFIPSVLRVEVFCGDYMRKSIAVQSQCTGDHCQDRIQSPILLIALAATIIGGALMSLAQRFRGRRHAVFAIGTWIGLQTASLGATVLIACLFEVSARHASSHALDKDGDYDIAWYGCVALVVLCSLLWTLLPGSPLRKKIGHVLGALAVAGIVQWRVFQVPADETGKSATHLLYLTWITAGVILGMPIIGPLRFTLPFIYNRWRLQKFLYASGNEGDQPAGAVRQESHHPAAKASPAPPFGLSVGVHLPRAESAVKPKMLRRLRTAQRLSFIAEGSGVYSFNSPDEIPPWLRNTESNGVVTEQPGPSANLPTSTSKLLSHNGLEQASTRRRVVTADNVAAASERGEDEMDGMPALGMSDGEGGEDETDMALSSDYIDFNLDAGMTLGDIDRASGGEIEILSQIVANKWRLTDDDDEQNSQLMVLSSKRVDILSKAPTDEAAHGVQLGPDDIRISDAMALSGAALSLNNGVYSETFALVAFRALQLIFGVAIGTSLLNVDNPTKWLPNQKKTIAANVSIYVLMSASVLCHGLVVGGDWPVYVELLVSLCVTFAALMPTRGLSPDDDVDGPCLGWLAKATKSFQDLMKCISVQCHAAFLIREFLDIEAIGLEAPSVFSASDGGHIENLGLLPLLHRRCKRIVIADGGSYADRKDVAGALMMALEMARTWLQCSFTGMDGGDIMFDIRQKLISPALRRCGQPHGYRFKVLFPEGLDVHGVHRPAETGEILLLQPRHPQHKSTGPSSGTLPHDSSAEQQGKTVDELTGCCCSCCHGRCHALSYAVFGRFPAISTLAQGFTQELFSAFHEEGLRAASASDAVRFWSQKES
ncbi:uncharacterized protein LOC135814415 [Sycon ciliatum]|uniref:uncharacterized protein LOC135814415 n=1 Tax=Sycon ciliatum TaxID=27933 RepID=UPI0031F5FD44